METTKIICTSEDHEWIEVDTIESDYPTIFIFSNVLGGREGACFAIAEDGECLGSHWCSSESFVRIDLGPRSERRADAYAEKYPDGYVVEWVRAEDVPTHEGLTEAMRLNKEKGESDAGSEESDQGTEQAGQVDE